MKGLSFLHSSKNVHRDVKPSNLLISQDGRVKVADLGLLKHLGSNTSTKSFVGTTSFMSPERLQGEQYDSSADIWSFGMAILALAIGSLPNGYKDGYWTLLQSIKDNRDPLESLSPEFSCGFRDFVSKCLCVRPAERPTADELLQHPFLANDVTEVNNDSPESELARIDELRSIFSTLFQHVDSIKSTAKADDDVLMGLNIATTPLVTILKTILFGNDDETKQQRTITRPRLAKLARQLYLSPEIISEEANNFISYVKHCSSSV